MYSDYQNQTPIVINDRSSEGLADANIRIGNMLSEETCKRRRKGLQRRQRQAQHNGRR